MKVWLIEYFDLDGDLGKSVVLSKTKEYAIGYVTEDAYCIHSCVEITEPGVILENFK